MSKSRVKKQKKRGAKKVSAVTHKQIRKSNLSPKDLVRKASKEPNDIYIAQRSFDDLPLDSRLKENIKRKGYVFPTEIQDKTFEFILEKRDVLGIAQTGTGKTGAFLIPLIQRNLKLKRNPFVLVVVPTRELALQIEKEFKSISKNLKQFSHTFIGGTNINKDVQALRRPAHFIFGTPRRLLELIKLKALNLKEVNTLVIDEFDQLLALGFLKEIEHITGAMHRRQHTLLFSATLNKKQLPLLRELLYNPVTIKLSKQKTTGDHIDQDVVYYANEEEKINALVDVLDQNSEKKTLIFEESKYAVEQLYKQLELQGVKSSYFHGGMLQKDRVESLKNFDEGKTNILIATDIASRGLDVSDISLVINYQLPLTFDNYTHRIGRTGRVGKKGMALTFVKKG